MEKIEKAQKLVESVLNRKSKKLTLKELQPICGLLNFLGRAIVLGCTFMCRLYAFTQTYNGKLKPYHHIRINNEMKSDLTMWCEFLNHPSVYACEFMDFRSFSNAQDIEMFSDASKALNLGMGGVCGMSWIFAT